MLDNKSLPDDLREWPPELLRIIPIVEVERVSSLSRDSIIRHHRDKLIHLSARRLGMRFGHAVTLRK
jgi:hypothetical protein